MQLDDQFFRFYTPNLKQVVEAISKGKLLIFVGINSIGKNILAEQILSPKFRQEFLGSQKVRFVFVSFKDQNGITPRQIQSTWLAATASTLGPRIDVNDLNNFSFYSEMTQLLGKLPADEKICFVVLDAQHTLALDEAFFQSLMYLQIYAHGKVSYMFLSEPHILENKNSGLLRLLYRYERVPKFIFLKHHDARTVAADIERQERQLGLSFQKYHSLILKYCRGLHGVTRTFCHLLRDNPAVKNIRELLNIWYNNQACRYWLTELLDSLPRESIRILKEVTFHPERSSQYKKDFHYRWLIDLGFLKPSGKPRYPIINPILKDYAVSGEPKQAALMLKQNLFYVGNDRLKLTKKELAVLTVLYNHRGKSVNNDTLGEALWKGTPEKFSLWAIAQVIRRLRKKLAFYFLPPQTIRSVRGEGYLLNSL